MGLHRVHLDITICINVSISIDINHVVYNGNYKPSPKISHVNACFISSLAVHKI